MGLDESLFFYQWDMVSAYLGFHIPGMTAGLRAHDMVAPSTS
jgi:hypothetical protein